MRDWATWETQPRHKRWFDDPLFERLKLPGMGHHRLSKPVSFSIDGREENIGFVSEIFIERWTRDACFSGNIAHRRSLNADAVKTRKGRLADTVFCVVIILGPISRPKWLTQRRSPCSHIPTKTSFTYLQIMSIC